MTDSARDRRELAADRRGVTPAVGKALEIAVVVLYLGVVTTALYAGAVPDYRDTAGGRVGERATVAAAAGVENAVPATARADRIERRVRVELPDTIRGAGYWLRVDNRTLVLDHPRPAVSGRVRLTLPGSVVSVSGRWSSYEPAVVVVEGSSDRLRVRLVRG